MKRKRTLSTILIIQNYVNILPDRRTFRPKQTQLIFPRSLKYLYFAFKQNYLRKIFRDFVPMLRRYLTEIDLGRKLASLGHVYRFQFRIKSTHRYWWLDTRLPLRFEVTIRRWFSNYLRRTIVSHAGCVSRIQE